MLILEVFLERALNRLAAVKPQLTSALEFAIKRTGADLPTPDSYAKDAKPIRHPIYCTLSLRRTLWKGWNINQLSISFGFRHRLRTA